MHIDETAGFRKSWTPPITFFILCSSNPNINLLTFVEHIKSCFAQLNQNHPPVIHKAIHKDSQKISIHQIFPKVHSKSMNFSYKTLWRQGIFSNIQDYLEDTSTLQYVKCLRQLHWTQENVAPYWVVNGRGIIAVVLSIILYSEHLIQNCLERRREL